MPDSDKRLRYYNGQFLQQEDFNAEQAYHLDRQRRHNRQLHTFGIADGLVVNVDSNLTSASVSPGTAIDGEGRVIVLTESRTVQFNSLTGSVLVVIRYHEETSDPATVGDEGDTRIFEQPEVEVIAESGAPPADVRIRLARLQIAANGTASQPDTSVRTTASARLGTGVVGTNQLAANAVTAPKIADLSVTTAKIADLGVTTAKIADLGVSTGKIADLGVTAAKIAANAVTTAKIADSNVTGAKISDGTINEVKLDPATRAKLGGVLTSGGTINGNLNIIGSLQVGGPVSGFGLDKMFATTLTFTATNGDGTIRSVGIDFIPSLILLTGGISGRFDASGDTRFGSLISGFAYRIVTVTGGDGGPDTSFTTPLREVSSAPPSDPGPLPPFPTNPVTVITITQLCHGPNIVRSSAGLVRQDINSFGAIAGASFLNRGTSPVQGTAISLSVTAMDAGNVTFRLGRTQPTGASAFLDVESFSFNVLILGHLDNNLF